MDYGIQYGASEKKIQTEALHHFLMSIDHIFIDTRSLMNNKKSE